MKKLKKLIVTFFILCLILATGCTYASQDLTAIVEEMKFSDEFEEWKALEDDERTGLLIPRSVEIIDTTYVPSNPIKVAQTLGSTTLTKFDLREYILQNLLVKNQGITNSCWAFATIGMLESSLGLQDYYKDNPLTIYDFSERHMEYATTRVFKNGEINEAGFDRKVDAGGNYYLSRAYMTSGLGPVAEEEMPFSENKDLINLSEIQDKEVVAQVLDFVEFPTLETGEDKTELMKNMKDHIKNKGGIEAGVYGAQLFSNYYNNETGAIYCKSSTTCPANHDVVIIGWDDNYEISNFNEYCQPTKKGAWIIKNSWGDIIEYTLEEMKENIFNSFEIECREQGWNSPEEIPDDFAKEMFKENGYTVVGNTASLKIGDNGFMYVSYEDANIYAMLQGVENITTEVEYENIYQYNNYGAISGLTLVKNKVYLASVFEKVEETEYLTQVSVDTLETVTCKVYVNPNGESKAKDDLIEVELQAGESETFGAGYHTLEFATPVEIKANKFAIVVEMTGTRTDKLDVPLEVKVANTPWSVVKTEKEKTFICAEDGFEANEWLDAGDMYTTTGGKVYNGDICIKAFSVSEIPGDTLESIEITTPPTKTEYEEGQDFDDTGMVVSAVFVNGEKEVITDYTIENGEDLKLDQTVVIIKYKGKVVTQKITVKENPNNEENQKPEVSNFDNAVASAKNVKVYYFTDKTKQEYTTMNVEVEGIKKSNKNDSYEYYYYLSSTSSQKNIINWVKITEKQTLSDGLKFSINTKKISNYDEILKSDNLYLYIKEVAKKGETQKSIISEAMLLESKTKAEIYKDNVKQTTQTDDGNKNNNQNNQQQDNQQNNNQNNNQNNQQQNNNDGTTSNVILPAAGLKIGLLFVIFAIAVFGIIKYLQYKRMNF